MRADDSQLPSSPHSYTDLMRHLSRTLAAAAAAVTVLTASGCALFGVPTEDSFPDNYEQALVDTLDASEIVVQHDAAVDGWERASNIPPRDAQVEITPRASEDGAAALLDELLDVAATHSQPLPSLMFDIPDLGVSFTFAGEFEATDAHDALSVAFTDGWGRVSAFGGDDGMSTSLFGGADTVDDAKALLAADLPASVTADVNYSSIVVGELTSASNITAQESLVLQAAIDVAAALEGMNEQLPTADGSATFEVNSSVHADSGELVHVSVEVRADGLNDAESEDRPAIAEEMGYTDFCHDVEAAAVEGAGETELSFRCVATHVDID